MFRDPRSLKIDLSNFEAELKMALEYNAEDRVIF
jgi:hypothetical protein